MQINFSIIIPTFNRAHLIEQTIHSVLRQDYLNYELIIVDDGSTDTTKEVIENIIKNNSSHKISYLNQLNSERAVSRNNGLHSSTGDYIIFFDSDDTLYPNHLSVAHDYVMKTNMPEFLHLRYDVKDAHNKITGEGPLYNTPPNNQLIHGNFLSCNGVVLRRDVALQNLFNENRDLSGMEDWELWLRLSVKYPLHYLNTITSSVINHAERSVVGSDKNKLIKKVETLMELVLSNDEITAYYKTNLTSFKCSCFSYLSLHLALIGQKKEAVNYLLKSISLSPPFLFKKRFLAIIKHLF